MKTQSEYRVGSPILTLEHAIEYLIEPNEGGGHVFVITGYNPNHPGVPDKFKFVHNGFARSFPLKALNDMVMNRRLYYCYSPSDLDAN